MKKNPSKIKKKPAAFIVFNIAFHFTTKKFFLVIALAFTTFTTTLTCKYCLLTANYCWGCDLKKRAILANYFFLSQK